MTDDDRLAERFEANRSHLHAVAHRLLGSSSDADDAVQETWIRLSRSDTTEVRNLGGWLTTVVARLCLDMLRSRKSRREVSLDGRLSVPIDGTDPEHEALLVDSIGPALVVLDTLAPAERLAFVLHDMFDVPFAEIATIVGRSPAATRQLACRARRRVREADGIVDPDPAFQRRSVDAFRAASRNGDLDPLLVLLDSSFSPGAESA